MSDTQPNLVGGERPSVMRRIVRFLPTVILLWIMLAMLGLDLFLSQVVGVAFHFLFGWVLYLKNVLPRAVVNHEIALGAAIALVGALYGLHCILRWWTRKSSDASAPWKVSWTVKITAMVLLLFAASVTITGIVHSAGWLLGTPRFVENRDRAYLTMELSNVRQVAIALRLYASDHEEKSPDSLHLLVPDYFADHQLLFSAHDPSEPPESILYYSGYSEKDPTNPIILASPSPTANGKRAIAHSDGSAGIVSEAEFQKLIQQQQSRVTQGKKASAVIDRPDSRTSVERPPLR